MAVKVAINGFGRIGRLAFRQMFGAEGYEVVAINDLTKPSMLADLLKYDTAQGGYCGKIGENLHTVSADDEANTITVDGKTLQIYAEKDAKDCPWGKLGVDVVLECTGFYTSKFASDRSNCGIMFEKCSIPSKKECSMSSVIRPLRFAKQVCPFVWELKSPYPWLAIFCR